MYHSNRPSWLVFALLTDTCSERVFFKWSTIFAWMSERPVNQVQEVKCQSKVKAYHVYLPLGWQVGGLCPAAVWTDCVQRPIAARQPRPSHLYWDLSQKKKTCHCCVIISMLAQPEAPHYLQAQGMWGKMTSMLIFSLSPRDVSTYSSGWTCREQTAPPNSVRTQTRLTLMHLTEFLHQSNRNLSLMYFLLESRICAIQFVVQNLNREI